MLHLLLLVLFKCPGDIPEVSRKVNAILVSIGLTMVITTIILFSKPFYPFISSNHCYYLLCRYFLFMALEFFSFSGLLAMVIALAIQKKQRMKLWFKFA
jgi:hypothetical protein